MQETRASFRTLNHLRHFLFMHFFFIFLPTLLLCVLCVLCVCVVCVCVCVSRHLPCLLSQRVACYCCAGRAESKVIHLEQTLGASEKEIDLLKRKIQQARLQVGKARELERGGFYVY